MKKTDVVIAGAGVVGLAIASELSKRNLDIVLIERHDSFGKETSSRNSEVIHAGIYYPQGSLKAQLCVEGNRLLYELCDKNRIKHKKIGKYIVAVNTVELESLENLMKTGQENNVHGLELITKKKINEIEPHIRAVGALFSPNTGIIDSHGLIKYFEAVSKDNGVMLAYNCEIKNVRKIEEGYRVDVNDADKNDFSFVTDIFINSTGLFSDRIAELAGINIDKAGYRLHYCKGEYFRIGNSKNKYLNHLVYPHPTDNSLGIHVVIDLQGQMKLGPNAFYVDKIDYTVNPDNLREAYESSKRYLPFIELADLSPDTSGIRPKLQGPGEPVKDFVITEESKKGFAGFINLIGMESPALTASPAIAQYVLRNFFER